jgi:hypothetical protein
MTARLLVFVAVAVLASCVRLADGDRRWPCGPEEPECPDGQTCTNAGSLSSGGPCSSIICACLPKGYCNYDQSRGLLVLISCDDDEICSGQRCKEVSCESDEDCAGWDGVEALCADGRCRQVCGSGDYSTDACFTGHECFDDPNRTEDDRSYCRPL